MSEFAFILAGGSGERFWPLSRKGKPKQLLRLGASGATLLEEAIARASTIVEPEAIRVSCSREFGQQMREAGLEQLPLLAEEPEPRNTLGAIVWATATLLAERPELGEDTALAILTSDHRISTMEQFGTAARRALNLAKRRDSIVTFGIRPTRAESGYGHILAATEAVDDIMPAAYRVERFVEKPQEKQLDDLMGRGPVYWNSGMFFWTLRTFRRELSRVLPEVDRLLDALADSLRTGDQSAALETFRLVPSKPIDVALIENAHNTVVVEADFDWEDVGSVSAFSRLLEQDADGNATLGRAILMDCRNTIVYGEASERIVCALGLENVAIVVDRDAVLVIPIERAQEVRRIVNQLRETAPEMI